jgi:hypothetical protein
MLELRQPLDFERLPEFRLLVANLARSSRAKLTDKQAEAIATFLWLRLWVDLGYLAQKTNRPGWLSRWGADEFRRSVGALFGEEGGELQPDPVKLFADGPAEMCSLTALADGEYECPLFARLNKHLSGDFATAAEKGNQASIVSRQQTKIMQDSVAQAMLFTEKVAFKTPTGQPLEGTELNRCTVIIKNSDNSLELGERSTERFSQGMYSDAFAVMEKFPPMGNGDKGHPLLKFYQWLYINRKNQAVPKSTEKILAEFEVWAKQAGIA